MGLAGTLTDVLDKARCVPTYVAGSASLARVQVAKKACGTSRFFFSLTSQISGESRQALVRSSSFFSRPPEPSAGPRGRASVSARARGKGEGEGAQHPGGTTGPPRAFRGAHGIDIAAPARVLFGSGQDGARRARRGDAPGARARLLRGAGLLRRAYGSARAPDRALRLLAPRLRVPEALGLGAGGRRRSLVRSRASRFDASVHGGDAPRRRRRSGACSTTGTTAT